MRFFSYVTMAEHLVEGWTPTPWTAASASCADSAAREQTRCLLRLWLRQSLHVYVNLVKERWVRSVGFSLDWPHTAPVWGSERPRWTTACSPSDSGRGYWEECDRLRPTAASPRPGHGLNTHKYAHRSFVLWKNNLPELNFTGVWRHRDWPSGVQTSRTARKSCRLLSRTYLTLKCSFTATVLGQLAVMTNRGRSRRILGNLWGRGTGSHNMVLQ